MTPQQDQHYHSFEVQEIIERVPSWTSKWGISSLFVLLCILILVCSFVTIPVKKTFSVVLTLTNPPAYFTRQQGGVLNLTRQPIKILKGDTLVNNNIYGTYILAPYTGTLTAVNRSTNTKIDTIAVLVPDIVKYHIHGKVPLKFKKFINSGDRIKITINSPNLNEEVTVFGIVKEISPAALNDEISFYGVIEDQSNILLKKNFMYSSEINGFDEIAISDNTIMNMLIGKVK